MSLRYDYLSDLDDHDKSMLEKQAPTTNRLPVCQLTIPPSAISQDGTEWLHCVEATLERQLVRIRVISNTNRGINITVTVRTEEMYLKYLDLRFQVRNNDCVLVTFPEIYVKTSPHRYRELYLTANDFKIFGKKNRVESKNNVLPFPSLQI